MGIPRGIISGAIEYETGWALWGRPAKQLIDKISLE